MRAKRTLALLVFGFIGVEQGLAQSQGVVAGEVSESGVLLQVRLTANDSAGDGPSRFVQFEWSASESLERSNSSRWLQASADKDHIVRIALADLQPDTVYAYRAHFKNDASGRITATSPKATFRTLAGPDTRSAVTFVFMTCLNYAKFTTTGIGGTSAAEAEGHQGYRGLETIRALTPDYVVLNGDVVYYDRHVMPDRSYRQADSPNEVSALRQKFHEQFSQPRFRRLFQTAATFWLKDDHDYRSDDGHPYSIGMTPSHDLGIAMFREQVPILPASALHSDVTYRTRRVNKDLQLWFLEGRDFRSANTDPDDENKTLWGFKQRQWLMDTLLASDATFKVIVTPTPMVGPDDARKSDNHTKIGGFRAEQATFFRFLRQHDFDFDRLFIVTGDRHWQFHSEHPIGLQEFSSGALDDTNARAGHLPGASKSTDPDAKIIQHYSQVTQDQVSGGFLRMRVEPAAQITELIMEFMDEYGALNYAVRFIAESGAQTNEES